MAVTWDDEVDAILTGDLTGALGYGTPAGGVVVQAVAPIGLTDRAAGTIGFTTSLGFSRKLERIARDPRVAMAYHAREHGFAGGPAYVLVQGNARVIADPSPEQLQRVRTLAAHYLGPPAEGWFWDRWLREYYAARVPVEIDVERIVVWPDLGCAGSPRIIGQPLEPGDPPPQKPPAQGTAARVDAARAGRRMRGTRHQLIGFAGPDGRPVILPITIEHSGTERLELSALAPLPRGGRRAGLLGHSYRPKLIGLEARQYTGWLEVDDDHEGLYAPHTEHGYKAPPNKTLLLTFNGLLAKRGIRAARKSASSTDPHPPGPV
jgi:hypothetical protein